MRSMSILSRFIFILAMSPFALLPGTAAASADLIRSPADNRHHEALTLDNGLRVLLVSDPDTNTAAAALNVGIGYFSDPPDRAGLAHFLEHMLFLGTRKYPEPDAYREFIIGHGGRHNAATGAEHTSYFFDVGSEHLNEALDRFAQFFIAPLFNPEYVRREMQAVEAEYRLRLRDDGRRLNDAVKETVNPAHPYAKFSTGNLETLGDRENQPAREAVIALYDRYYSANLMTLAVIGAEPLPKLRSMVERHFGPIRNTDAKAPTVTAPLFSSASGAQRLDVVPFRDQRLLRMEFTYPWQESYALSKPTAYLAHLIGDEGRGSLYAILQSRGWITQLSAGGSRMADNEGLFSISMELTEAGARRIDEIAAQVFHYLRLIEKRGIDADIHDELTRISRLNFLYREPAVPRSEAVTLAANMQLYPLSLALAGPYHLESYDEQTIRLVLSALRPERARLTVVAPELSAERESRYYNTPYALRSIDDSLTRWAAEEADPDLALPAPNDFVPRHARLKAAAPDRDRPALLSAERGVQIWHLQDGRFRVPKSDLFVTIESEAAVATARGAAFTSLFLSLLREALTPHTYAAEVAGLRHSVYKTTRGFGFSISGYDENKRLLCARLLDELLGFEVNADAFAIRRDELLRQWENRALDGPYVQLFSALDDLLHLRHWPAEALQQALRETSPQEFAAFIPTLLSAVRLEIFIHGNLTAAEARDLGDMIAERIRARAKPGPALVREVTRIAPGSQYLRSVSTRHDDSAVLLYYQAQDAGIDTAARVLMIEQLLKSAFFDTLRTQEQLGYVVNAQTLSALRVPGLAFLVQSPTQGTAPLAARIERFIADYRAEIATMDALDFARHRQAVLTGLREKDTSLARRSQRLQAELSLGEHGFDRRERLAAAVEGLNHDAVLAFYDSHLLSDQRRRIILQAAGQKHREQAIAAVEALPLIQDIEAFHRGSARFRLPADEGRDAPLANLTASAAAEVDFPPASRQD